MKPYGMASSERAVRDERPRSGTRAYRDYGFFRDASTEADCFHILSADTVRSMRRQMKKRARRGHRAAIEESMAGQAVD